ncbi:MAG: hypothetical protein II304_10590 [Bacteroidales bacterium]|nr:hypothetical protein [Bacteroidales bacterium]
MIELIQKLHRILCEIKDFNAGHSSDTIGSGKMIIEYKDKRYAVFIEEMGKCDDEDTFSAMKRLKYWF